MAPTDPQAQRDFALSVVERLRARGHTAYWAGGCVRDQLLGRTPKDYDVATNATPLEIREAFGRKRTLEIGIAFGVVAVRGPAGAGLIEVATFRRDASYSDGRHPDAVTFSSPEDDAARRDFTINGLFFDPVAKIVIDYVGGREDLQRRLIRAIGEPRARFAEDKLRMLRAVRFAATFDFTFDHETQAALVEMADQVTVVSPERIAAEMRVVLSHARRAEGMALLRETTLLSVVAPEFDGLPESDWRETLAVLAALGEASFPLALAALAHRVSAPGLAIESLARSWRLATREAERAAWLVTQQRSLDDAPRRRWSETQPLLIEPGIDDLIALVAAIRQAASKPHDDLAWCRQQLIRTPDDLNPPPLVSGHDLLSHGVPASPRMGQLIATLRAAQLDGEIHSRAEALTLVDRLLAT
ncbi:MAG: CCA tRNA nucleotidyltransferase [Pirellulales bacterium]|nr:CCA tRNA nucleotidyltransferase [Pirellulales bacterium]